MKRGIIRIIIIGFPVIAGINFLFSKKSFECKGNNQIVILNKQDFDETMYDLKSLFNTTFNLESSKSPRFDFLNYDIDPENLEMLIAKLNCIIGWIENNKKANKKYAEDILRFTIILEFIAIVNNNFKSKKLTEAQAKKFAQDIQNDIEKKLQQIITINSRAVKSVDEATDNSKTWKNTVPVFSQFERERLLGKNGEYTDMLKDFVESKMESKDYFNAILNSINEDLISKQFNLKQLQNTVNDLEKIIYRLKLSHSFDIFNLKQQLALAKFCKDYLNAIINYYGNFLYFKSESLKNKLKVNKDFASQLIIKTSRLVFIVLNKLYGEIVKKSGNEPILPFIVNN